MSVKSLVSEISKLYEAETIELFSEKDHWGLDIQLKETNRGFQVVSNLGGYQGDTYKPNFETEVMGSGRTWERAVDNAAKKCAKQNEDTEILSDLLIGKEHFANNGHAKYFVKKLEEAQKALEEMDESINEDKSFEEEVFDAFETVRGFIETTMKNIKVSSKPQNFVRLANAMNKLKLASDAYEMFEEEVDEIKRNKLLQSAYRSIQAAKEQFN